MKHILTTKQFFDQTLLDELFALAEELEKQDKEGTLKQTLSGKVLATVFYEASTRTRFSFESGMLKLGGRVISTESASHFSSVTKGESLQDTIKTIASYADGIVLRHSEKGSAAIAASVSSVPIINAGDGAGEHPTQALLDLYTIKKECGKINGLRIALAGDLLYGRTIHSLLYLLTLYGDIKLYLVSPPQLKIPDMYKENLTLKGINFVEVTNVKTILSEVDVIYMTRIQKERFPSLADYEQIKNSCVLDAEGLAHLHENAVIMHPLPRVNEITTDVDSDKRAAYFRQAKNGLYIRMALLQKVFNGGM